MNLIKSFLERLEQISGADRWYHAYSLGNLAAGGVSILIPLYVLHLGKDVGAIGLLTATGNLVGIFASLTWGALSDRFNRRKGFAVLGLTGVGLSFLLMGFFQTYSVLLLLNAFYILFWMAAASVGTILIIEKEKRGSWDDKIGAFNFSSGLGWTVGLGVGLIWLSISSFLLVEETSIRLLFVILGLFALAGGAGAVLWIPSEVKFDRSRFRGRLVETGDLITERFRYLPIHLYYLLKPGKIRKTVDRLGTRLSVFLFAVGLTFSGFAVFFVPVPAYLKDTAGLGEGIIYLIFIASGLSSTLFYRPAARFTKSHGPRRVLPAALAFRIVLFPLVTAPFLLLKETGLQLIVALAVFVIIGGSWAFINVSNLVIVSSLSDGQLKGQVFGIYNAINGASLVIGSLVGGYLAKFGGYLTTFLLASLFVALGLGIIRSLDLEPVFQ